MNFPKHKITLIRSRAGEIEKQKKAKKDANDEPIADNYFPEIISNKLNDQKNNSKQIFKCSESKRNKSEKTHLTTPHLTLLITLLK